MNRTGNIRVTGYLSDGVYFGGGSAATLRFSDIGTNQTGSVDSLVDNVGINAVPEPASLALMGQGLLGVLAARRRKQG